MLTASELIQNKGTACSTWNEWEKSTNVLPKTGKKQFEPNDSWLQKLQIEKGLKNRKDLLAIERVERTSQLAIAEWLPNLKKARVIKKSGQDWCNFGIEINCALYLIPEETLLLLEMNCLELLWNGVTVSIQQAYEILIDDSECTLEEYRVYSELIRCGYRIQRFYYNQTGKDFRTDECTTTTKKKVIVEPENGLRMSDNQLQVHAASGRAERTHSKKCISDSNVEADEDRLESSGDPVEKDVKLIIEELLDKVEDRSCTSDNRENPSNLSNNDSSCEQATVDIPSKRKRSSKIEIISEETLFGDIKVVKDSVSNSSRISVTISKWPGTRIQRNVKLLPRRTDKLSTTDNCTVKNKNTREIDFNKRRSPASSGNVQLKKSKHEVIELSDDEIQEVPCRFTRMEMLNLIPNIAALPIMTKKISPNYIPRTIKLQNNTLKYDRRKLQALSKNDSKLRLENLKGKSKQGESPCDNATKDESTRNDSMVPFHSNEGNSRMYNNAAHGSFAPRSAQISRFDSNHFHNNRFPFNHNRLFWQNMGTLVHQNPFDAYNPTAFGNVCNIMQYNNRFPGFHMQNVAAVPFLGESSVIRNLFSRNVLRQNFHPHLLLQNKFYQQKMQESNSIRCNAARHASPTQFGRPSSNSSNAASPFDEGTNEKDKAIYQSSFVVLSGASSWSELKKKWREEKTITIDDEDTGSKGNATDYNEVEVVQLTQPLVGFKNAGSFPEIYERLRIIKSAPEKTVRRKKGKYKISYNVYSSSQHYKKTNPGSPLYRLVVIRQKDSFLQPIELSRLQQDAKGSAIIFAYVSSLISYVQPGIVSLPNLL